MFRALSNLFSRSGDATRDWVFDPSRLIVDVELCTLCGAAVGGKLAGFAALGPSEDARASARGLPNWRSRGVYCSVADGSVSDFTIELASSRGGGPSEKQTFPGGFTRLGRPLDISVRTTAEQLRELLGEPFAESDADGERVVFYEYPAGETQFTFDRSRRTLEAIECWYEPELSDPRALESYRIERAFPDELRRIAR